MARLSPALSAYSILTPLLPSQDIRFKHIDVASGVELGRVNAILQDSRRFMWIGTDEAGLSLT